MRQFILGAAAFGLAAMGFVSCNNEDLYVEPKQTAQQSDNMITISASTQSGNTNSLQKAVLQDDMKSVYFSKNEEAKVFFYNDENAFSSDPAKFTGNNDAAAATTEFFGSGKAELAAADHAIAYIPASQVGDDGVPTLKSEQEATENGFDPEAFIASGIVNKEKLSVEFKAEVAFLKITADGNYNITIAATGICGSASAKDNTISMNDLKKGNTYFVAVWPGEYKQITITNTTNNETLRKIESVKFTAGKVYSVRQDIKVALSDLNMSTNIPKSATKIVFDYSKNVNTEGMTLKASILDGKVKIYNTNSNEYYVLSDGNICMTGSLYEMFNEYSLLETISFNNFSTEKVTDMKRMFRKCTILTELDLSGFNTQNVTDMQYMFNTCEGLKSLNVSKLNTSKVTNMRSMFGSCHGLKSIDLSSFNTSSVTSMLGMFNNCDALEKLDLSNFDTHNVTMMRDMFYQCKKLEELNITSFNTRKVEAMNYMFDRCINLVTLDLSSFNTSSVENMVCMFFQCTNLKTIITSKKFSTENLVDESASNYMFEDCTSLVGGKGTSYKDAQIKDKAYACIDGGSSNPGYFTCYDDVNIAGNNFNRSNFSDATKIVFDRLHSYDVSAMEYKGTMGSNEIKVYKSGTEYYILSNSNICFSGSMNDMFKGLSNLTSIEFKNFNTEKVESMYNMFSGCSGLTSLDLSEFDTKNVTNMSYMFSGCSGLTSLDLSGLNTSNVLHMNDMFNGCKNLQSLDISGFNTSKVNYMQQMFMGCSSLKSLDLSGFNTSSVLSMSQMFQSCSKLETLDLSGFNTSRVNSMYQMFYECTGLKSLNLSGFKNNNVTTFQNMFFKCWELQELNLTGFTTSAKCTNMDCMFYFCKKIETLDLSGFNTENVKDMGSMFCYCFNIKILDLSGFNTQNVTDMGYLFNGCDKLTTIYASSAFVTSKVTNSRSMFYCIYIVGGAGTEYDYFKRDDKSLARIDDPDNGKPGYFTAPPAASSSSK